MGMNASTFLYFYPSGKVLSQSRGPSLFTGQAVPSSGAAYAAEMVVRVDPDGSATILKDRRSNAKPLTGKPVEVRRRDDFFSEA